MNKEEAKIISDYLIARDNELHCSCEDCAKEYEAAKKKLQSLGDKAKKILRKRKIR